MVTIYKDYDDEPEDIFLPLPEELASEFYALEMDKYTADIDFFEPFLPQQGAILELGCGTGRIAGKLAKRSEQEGLNRFVVGIDISLPMLRLATQKRHPYQHSLYYLCMDMVNLAFLTSFDVILIPYNTLNLLGSENRITQCLQGCRNFLRPGGKLLVQLFVPTKDFIQQKKTFQFQMFEHPEGGKIIKEILRQYEPQSQTVQIEERFRVRPMQADKSNEDWNATYTIAGFRADQWLSFFRRAGFTPADIYADATGRAYRSSTSPTLFAAFTLQYN